MAYDITQSGGWWQMLGKHPQHSTLNEVAVVADARGSVLDGQHQMTWRWSSVN